MGAIAVAEAGPEIELEGERPAGGGVAAGIERFAGAGGEFGRRIRGDLGGGVEPPEVRDVAMQGLGLTVRL